MIDKPWKNIIMGGLRNKNGFFGMPPGAKFYILTKINPMIEHYLHRQEMKGPRALHIAVTEQLDRFQLFTNITILYRFPKFDEISDSSFVEALISKCIMINII